MVHEILRRTALRSSPRAFNSGQEYPRLFRRTPGARAPIETAFYGPVFESGPPSSAI
jgi:hypothetical protein